MSSGPGPFYTRTGAASSTTQKSWPSVSRADLVRSMVASGRKLLARVRAKSYTGEAPKERTARSTSGPRNLRFQ